MRNRKVKLHEKRQAIFARVGVSRFRISIQMLVKDNAVHVLPIQEKVHAAFAPHHRVHVELRCPFFVKVDLVSQALASIRRPQDVSMVVWIVRIGIGGSHEQVRSVVFQDVDLAILRPGKYPALWWPAHRPPCWPRIHLGLDANSCVVLPQQEITCALRSCRDRA